MYVQKTIKKQVSCSGIGLHTGNPVNMTFKPAAINSGILFKRMDLDGHPILKIHARNIGDLSYATTVGAGEAAIKTIEHVLSAMHALGVTNVLIELDSNEAPVLDGSSSCFIKMLLDAGLTAQNAMNKLIRIQHPIEVRVKDTIISVEPYDGLKMTYTIDFSNPFIGTQTKTFELTPQGYIDDIMRARTFCLYEEIEYLWKMGLSKGGSLDNAVVFAQDRILNDSLRYDDEPVRHKILDLVGDLAFLGHPLLGHIKVYKGGHLLHAKFVKEIFAKPECWTYLVDRKLSPTFYQEDGDHADLFTIPKITQSSSNPQIFV
ncbi:UDP-3-O-[3-hydroxymyristoyl] N-acetylglucosamine deacetylase [candidate division KSB3 bacterium]|uniref:UDP-3-O-acyl-N-acetylglucosamine deacetylase n=1 Tax=candidate division KSB3 bacterium TaxID=2044937 RepID=A0A2G6KBV3_9BACT|nr:MAG: UDP-3-O-[3-hydroxymyristoyl] N-acetylglucosamine deacetylase [candidate division KSB3 bacterium]